MKLDLQVSSAGKGIPRLEQGSRLPVPMRHDLTGNFWNVVVNVDFKRYRSQLDPIDVILLHVETYQKNPHSFGTGRYVN
jgi:hypothetical protein